MDRLSDSDSEPEEKERPSAATPHHYSHSGSSNGKSLPPKRGELVQHRFQDSEAEESPPIKFMPKARNTKTMSPNSVSSSPQGRAQSSSEFPNSEKSRPAKFKARNNKTSLPPLPAPAHTRTTDNGAPLSSLAPAYQQEGQVPPDGQYFSRRSDQGSDFTPFFPGQDEKQNGTEGVNRNQEFNASGQYVRTPYTKFQQTQNKRPSYEYPSATLRALGRGSHNEAGMGSRGGPQMGMRRSGGPFVGYRKLEEWAKHSNPSLLVLSMTSCIEGLSKLLNQDRLPFAWMLHLLEALRNALRAKAQWGSLWYIFKCVGDSSFLDRMLETFLSEMKSHNYTKAYGAYCTILDVIEYINSNSRIHAPKCSRALGIMLEYGGRLNLLREGNELSRRMNHLLRAAQLASSAQPKAAKQHFSAIDWNEDTPPDSIQDLALFPDTAELDPTIEPFLRANKTRGTYRDLEHYLDVHFRLMREDYLEPIRQGLKAFAASIESGQRPTTTDLRFYYDVQLVELKYGSDQGLSHIVKFDNRGFEETDWEFSRRLMFGSLLVFTRNEDLFSQTAFATVAERDIGLLQKGMIKVVFHSNLEQMFTSSTNDRFIMAETTAYFESYRHVLEGLQEMKQLPLENYILYCQTMVDPPRYTERLADYNMTSIMHNPLVPVSIPVLSDEWPSACKTTLNKSQLAAMRLALTHELAVIQGPPGTGKTYVGLKIMKVLLDNKVTMTLERKDGPILVVCYTNHALDQFLEGILSFCDSGIVRVGGRSSSELLEKFNLRELRKNPSMEKTIRAEIRRSLDICRQNLKEVSRLVDRCWKELLSLDSTIVGVDSFKSLMTGSQLSSLTSRKRVGDNRSQVLRQWLRATNANVENHLRRKAEHFLESLVAKAGDTMPDEHVTMTRSGARAPFQTRVRIYRGWAAKYRLALESEIDQILTTPGPDEQGRLEELTQATDEMNMTILPDSVLEPYQSSSKVMAAIRTHVLGTSQKRKRVGEEEGDGEGEEGGAEEKDDFIKQWVLGGFNRIDEILDAIEKLSGQKHEKDAPQRPRINVDSEPSIRQNRWTVDSESDDSDDDFSFGSHGSDEESVDMDTIDEGMAERLASFRKLEQDYNEHAMKEVLMLQRAKRLGIDTTESMEDAADEGWQVTNNMTYGEVFRLLKKSEPYSEEEAELVEDMWSLPLKDRYRLYKYWVTCKKETISMRMMDLAREYKLTLRMKKEALSRKDISILKTSRVIGMTTTGAARHRSVLQAVGCRVIVVEEAAEVLESHIVTTLNNQCEHLILIGDHQQLRPNPTVHRLAVSYKLEISLFERLVKNQVPKVTLREQHRMRPEISHFIRFIYPNLEDHHSVCDFDNIQGVTSNVFFLHHTFLESGVEDSLSKSNLHEARFVTALCRYFLQHDYTSQQITVLAAYAGQVGAIRDEMEEQDQAFEGLRVTSIDNYQGEENDIILLSLVRSNREQAVGFLKTDNRVCVALSRAKKGLYVIGNMDILSAKSPLWHNIWETAKHNRVAGVHLPLRCVNHVNHVTYVSKGEDFEQEVPEGGCDRPCHQELPCGHTCTRRCHSSDPSHQETECRLPCFKHCPQGHACQKECREECGDCQVLVTKQLPGCGHEDQVPCAESAELAVCSHDCNTVLPCGHVCRDSCGKCRLRGLHQPCLEKVDKTWPGCQHTAQVECCTDTSQDPCPAKCKAPLQCGHKCSGTCGGCLRGKVHATCKSKCKKPLPCGHPCTGTCSVGCVPCGFRCPSECYHATCGKECGELCLLCKEDCGVKCRHQACSALCMDDCDRRPCSRACGAVAKCGHKCASLCGEECVCYSCEKDNFILINFNKARPHLSTPAQQRERASKFQVEKDDVLMKLPKCGHIFTLKQLDTYMEKASSDKTSTAYFRCPACSAPIQCVKRYEKMVKERAQRRENKKEELIYSTRVPESKILQLQSSKMVAGRACLVDEDECLQRMPESIDYNHAQALGFQFRAAFVLDQVRLLHVNFNQDIELNLKKWERVVRSIRRHVTPQFRRELTMELHRLLLGEQLLALRSLVLSCPGGLPKEMKSALKEILNGDILEKMCEESKAKCEQVVERMCGLLGDLPGDSDDEDLVTKLKENVDLAKKALDMPDGQDLCSILED